MYNLVVRRGMTLRPHGAWSSLGYGYTNEGKLVKGDTGTKLLFVLIR